MLREKFLDFLRIHAVEMKVIRDEAWALHESVGQFYGDHLPYGYHLSMVVEKVKEFGHEVMDDEENILPLIFGAYFHDSLEDARLTYNDVTKRALKYMPETKARVAAELVYALTNEKGRTRAERAGERYYAGIRETPLAPFVKLCDRLANMEFSLKNSDSSNLHMREVYRKEWKHFLSAIRSERVGCSFCLPVAAVACGEALMAANENKRIL